MDLGAVSAINSANLNASMRKVATAMDSGRPAPSAPATSRLDSVAKTAAYSNESAAAGMQNVDIAAEAGNIHKYLVQQKISNTVQKMKNDSLKGASNFL